MRSPTIIYAIIAMLLISVSMISVSGCSSKEKGAKYITGNVISRPDYSAEETVPIPQPSSNMTGNSSGKGVIIDDVVLSETETMQNEYAVKNSIRCDDAKVSLGYKACYNISNGSMIMVALNNVGYDDITGIWFNIEVDGKPNYEATKRGIKANQSAEFFLDMDKWRKEYGSADRIIIVPLTKMPEGEKVCLNRAMLLVYQESCFRNYERY